MHFSAAITQTSFRPRAGKPVVTLDLTQIISWISKVRVVGGASMNYAFSCAGLECCRGAQ